jgi:hypothetical protein
VDAWQRPDLPRNLNIRWSSKKSRDALK